MAINFSGLASGLDTGAIIDALVSIERGRADIVKSQKADVQKQVSTIGNLTSLLKDLDSTLDGFAKSNEIRKMSVETSNENRVQVSTSGTATAGNFAIKTTALAASHSMQSGTFNTPDVGELTGGSFDIAVGTGTPVNIAYTSDDSLYDVAERITNADAGATASVLYDGSQYRLMITSEESGLANQISFTNVSGDFAFSQAVPAADAAFTINGIPVTRSSNTITDLVDGVTIKLTGTHEATEAATNLQVTQDTEATREKLKTFVDSYNKVMDLVNREMTYSGVQKDGGSLFGDSTLRLLQRTLNSKIATTYSTANGTTSLGILGIEMDNTGKLSIDSTKLEDTLNTNPRALESIFAGAQGNDGITKVLQDLVDSYTQSGGGLLSSKTESLNSRIKVFDDQIERIETRADSVAEQLNKQFSALEQAMSQLNSQQSYLGAMGF